MTNGGDYIKNIKYFLVIIPFILLAIFIFLFLRPKTSLDYKAADKVLSDLKSQGYEIEQVPEDKSILNGERIWVTINKKENISIYIYETNHKMEEDAGYVSEDGFSYETGKQSINVDWISYPHFYKTDNIIVLYVGDDQGIIKNLEKILGTHFAGATNP